MTATAKLPHLPSHDALKIDEYHDLSDDDDIDDIPDDVVDNAVNKAKREHSMFQSRRDALITDLKKYMDVDVAGDLATGLVTYMMDNNDGNNSSKVSNPKTAKKKSSINDESKDGNGNEYLTNLVNDIAKSRANILQKSMVNIAVNKQKNDANKANNSNNDEEKQFKPVFLHMMSNDVPETNVYDDLSEDEFEDDIPDDVVDNAVKKAKREHTMFGSTRDAIMKDLQKYLDIDTAKNLASNLVSFMKNNENNNNNNIVSNNISNNNSNNSSNNNDDDLNVTDEEFINELANDILNANE